MVPRCVLLSRCAATPALLTVLAVLGTRMCFALDGSGYVSEAEAVSAEGRQTPDSTMDLGRLLFKQMRFRDLSTTAQDGVRAGYPLLLSWLGNRPWRSRDTADSTKASRRAFNKVLKRENDKIVGNLAALISDMKDRDTDSQLLMPSLRFG